MTKKLEAFHNDSTIKAKYVERVKAHQEADEIVQGKYWENGKGCAVGCTIEGNQHNKYETELGIPRMIARLEDRIFEGLTKADAKKFPLRFLEAINVGADLSMVVPKFFVWMLIDKKDGVIKFAKTDSQKKAIQDVADKFTDKVNGKEVTREEWMELRRAAAAAAAAAAYAAAYAAAAAAYADADAAYARHKHFSKMADKLIDLLREAK